MPGTAGPRLGLVWGYAPHETGWGVGGFNPNFARLEALVSLAVISITPTPPGTPANGDCYIVGLSATGIWAGHDDDVAVYYTTGGWIYIDPAIGLRAFNRADSAYYRFDGADWIAESFASADVSGPVTATDGNVVLFDGPTGKAIRDGAKGLPSGLIVGTTDTQILENKIIDGSNNSLVVYLDADVAGNLPVENLNGGVGASSTTAWFGDGTWKPITTTGGGASVTISDTPPASPAVGDLWFDSGDTITLYVWMDDGSSSQWVPACNCPVVGSGGGGGGEFLAISGGTMEGPLILDDGSEAASYDHCDANYMPVTGPVSWSIITGQPATYPPTLPIAQSDVTNLTSDLAAKAPLASPTFIGAPSLPSGAVGVTQAAATNNTSLATTAFVQAQNYLTGNQTVTLSGDLTGSGTTAISATLATVNANVGTFQGLTVNAKGLVTGAVNQNYAPLASPTFSGTPSLPSGTNGVTQAAATNNTSLATTAYVKSQNYITGNQTITLSGDLSGSGTTAITATLNTVPIAKGGHGQTTAAAGLSALGGLPLSGGTMTGNLIINNVLALYSPDSSTQCTALFTVPGIRTWSVLLDTTGTFGFYDNTGGRFGLSIGTDAALHLVSNVLPPYDGGCDVGSPALRFNAMYSFNYLSTSAREYKDNIEPHPPALAAVEALAPATYTWRVGQDTKRRHSGFVADEVRATMGKDFGGLVDDNVAWPEMIAVLWQAVRELSEQVAELKGKLA